MNVTRDVIIDLWPVYESGEASPDTQRLVDQFLGQDLEFARLMRESPTESMRSDTLPPLRREQELETLRKTKRLVRTRDTLFFVAGFLSFTPLTVYDTSWGSGWVIRDHPLLAVALGLAAVAVWGCYFALKKRLSATGL